MTKQETIIVGLTGGIATGKSTSLLIFEQLGAKTVCCDKLAHMALRKNTKSYKAIVKQFGDKILDKNDRIDRSKVAEIVFKNKNKRKQLEDIVHPYVFKKLADSINTARGVLIVDVPLLFETGFEKQVDCIVVASCSKSEQLKRLMQRNAFSKEEANRRISAQMPLASKKRKADWVVNTGSLEEAMSQIKGIWEMLKKQNKR